MTDMDLTVFKTDRTWKELQDSDLGYKPCLSKYFMNQYDITSKDAYIADIIIVEGEVLKDRFNTKLSDSGFVFNIPKDAKFIDVNMYQFGGRRQRRVYKNFSA